MREINKSEIAEYINILGKFCGKRDIQELTTLELKKKYNIKKKQLCFRKLFEKTLYFTLKNISINVFVTLFFTLFRGSECPS